MLQWEVDFLSQHSTSTLSIDLFLDNNYGIKISFKLVLPNISLNMNVLKIIQARIQSIMFNKKVLQMISSASKIILSLKWHHHKQNQTWNFVLIATWVFRVFRILQINMI
jgi:hypothetical protein